MLRRLGDLTADEAALRVGEKYSAETMLEKLVAERRAAKVRVNGEERYIAAEDAGLYRDALGVPPPAGLPDSFLEAPENPLPALVRRYAATHGPFPTAQLANRYGIDPAPALRELESTGELVRGELLPGGTEREWCDADVLRRVRRASLAKLRREVEAADRSELARFLPSWQNVDAHRPTGAGPDRLREALIPLQGVTLTPKTWERDVLPRRLGTYSIGWLDELCTSGELVWIGAGSLGRNDGKVALYFREDIHLAGPPPGNAKLEAPEGDVHDAIRNRLESGPSFWLDLLQIDATAEELHEALWDLAWNGEVTNDAFAPLRAPRLRAAGGRRREAAGASRSAAPLPSATVLGRWSLTSALFEGAPPQGPRSRAQAELMLERHGIVTRETAIAEGIPGGFAAIYGELTNLELLGTATAGLLRRGPRRRPVRAARGGRAAAEPAAKRRLDADPGGDRPGQPLRRDAAVAEAARARAARRGPPTRTSPCATGCPCSTSSGAGAGILRLAPLEGDELGAALERALGRGPRRRDREARDRAPRRRARHRHGDGAGAGGRRLPPPAAPPGRLSSAWPRATRSCASPSGSTPFMAGSEVSVASARPPAARGPSGRRAGRPRADRAPRAGASTCCSTSTAGWCSTATSG